MVGFGTWSTTHEYPDKFTAIVLVSGCVSEINHYHAERLKNLLIWSFLNKGDEIVPPKSTEIMVSSINSIGGHAKLIIYDINSHDVYITFKNIGLYKWFSSFDQKKN